MNVNKLALIMKKFAGIIVALLVTGCATTSHVAQNISLGMSAQEVHKSDGEPYSKDISKDAKGNVVERWYYKETTWDDGGWSWDRTVVNSVVTFKNGKVESFSKAGKDRYKTKNPMASNFNMDITTHNE